MKLSNIRPVLKRPLVHLRRLFLLLLSSNLIQRLWYSNQFRKLREVDPLPWGRPIQRYGSGLIKLLSPACRLIFVSNRVFLPPLGVTALHFTQVPNVMAAPSSIPASNVAVIVAKLSHYLKVYDHMLRNKISKGFTQVFKLDFFGERKKLICSQPYVSSVIPWGRWF